MRIVQITDIHMTTAPPGASAYDAAGALEAVLAAAEALRPDLILLTGDLANDGLTEEYRRLREILTRVAVPMLGVPGNHDVRTTFYEELRDSAVTIGSGDSLHVAHEDGPVRLFGLDTLAPANDPSGVIGDGQLAWLRDRLEADDPRPVLVFMHHPPFRVGVATDDTRCYDGDDLGALLMQHPRVLGAVCGHLHRAARIAWAGTSGGVCPAVFWELPLELREDELPRLVPQAPAFQLHVFDPELGLVTHTQYVRPPA